MDTTTAIIITQIPIAIAILIGAYEMYRAKKELIKLLNQLSNNAYEKKHTKLNESSKIIKK